MTTKELTLEQSLAIAQVSGQGVSTPLELLESKRAELMELAKSSEGLTIAGIDDKAGFEKVHKAQMALRAERKYLEETRKNYTAQFDKKKAEAIALEKELLEIFVPIEDQLIAEKKRIEALKEEARLELERKAKEKLNHRVSELARVGATHDLFDLEMMKQLDFDLLLAEKTKLFVIEQERIEKEAQEKAKYEAERKTFEEEKAKLEAEKNAMEAEKNQIAREAEIKKAQDEAVERVKIETEERVKREAIQKKIDEERESETMKKRKKYRDWLEANNFVASDEMKLEKTLDGKKVYIWKKVSEFTI